MHVAVTLVLLGIILDAVDGKMARKLNASSKLGATLDSKADFVSFGIAPAIIVYRNLVGTEPLGISISIAIPLAIAAFYYVSVHFRLRRFDKGAHSQYFEGLPSPAGAAFIVVAAVSGYLSQPIIFSGLSILISILMISKLPYPHNEAASKKVLLRHLRIPTLIFMFSAMITLMGLPLKREFYIYEILFATMSGYILSPLLPARKSKPPTK
ncbi:MAG: CDP-diacylglycerol--serine O-phosphatidyltransferase [Candidatus Marinamargulisbacteria bacterium]